MCRALMLVFSLILLNISISAVELELIGSIPFDNAIFTQGLVYRGGNLYISGGLYGKSALYKYDLEKGSIEQMHRFENDVFAEGITLIGDTLVVLTWKKEQGFYFSLSQQKIIGTFGYHGEGWGLTGSSEMYMSNGSAYIRRSDVLAQLIESDMIPVSDDVKEYEKINELELIGESIYANVWYDDVILVIDKNSGGVTDKLYPKKLIPSKELEGCGVLNGIAYNAEENILYVTGKNWDNIYLFRVGE